MNIQGWFPLGFTCLISLMSKWLSRVFCSSTIQKHHFFDIQPYGPALTWSVHELWKNYSFGYMGLCRQSVVQSLIHVWLFAILWAASCQPSLSFTTSWSLLKLMTTKSVMPQTVSSSVIPFSSCLQCFPASGAFPMSQLFTSCGQSIGASV